MAKRKNRRVGKSSAVRIALRRMGWQAGARDVAAALAGAGIRVSEDLVQKVKVDYLKESGKIESRMAAQENLRRRRSRAAVGKTLLPRAGVTPRGER